MICHMTHTRKPYFHLLTSNSTSRIHTRRFWPTQNMNIQTQTERYAIRCGHRIKFAVARSLCNEYLYYILYGTPRTNICMYYLLCSWRFFVTLVMWLRMTDIAHVCTKCKYPSGSVRKSRKIAIRLHKIHEFKVIDCLDFGSCTYANQNRAVIMKFEDLVYS